MPVLENAKHEAFARAIVEGKNQRDAYRAAGYSGKDAAVDASASRLLSDAKVAARIAELKEQAADRTILTARQVLQGLSVLASSNMQDFVEVDDAGEPRLDFSELTREQWAAVGELTIEERTTAGTKTRPPETVRKTKFKLADKRGPLTDLGKHHGVLSDKVELTGKDGGPVIVRLPTQSTDAAEWSRDHAPKR